MDLKEICSLFQSLKIIALMNKSQFPQTLPSNHQQLLALGLGLGGLFLE
jgi:hypothetical protein